jgi:outer membrane protein assembly factor BamB
MPGPGPLAKPPLLWQFRATGPIKSSPAVVGDTVYVASTDGVVSALALGTGEPRWSAPMGAGLGSASPLVIGRLVVVGDRAGAVHALESDTGREAWRIETNGPIAGAAAIVGSTILLATEAGTAYALDAGTGTVRWQATLDGEASRSVAASAELVYVPLSHGRMAALRTVDGTLAWQAQFTVDGAGGTPTVAAGLVFEATGLDGIDPSTRAVVALDASTGDERWRRSSPAGQTLYTPAVSGGRAYIVAEDTVSAVDAASGDVRWTVATGAVNDALPAIWQSTVFIATNGGRLLALDADTGVLAWEVEIVGVPYAPVVTRGLVLVGTNVGDLSAFGELAP